MTGDGAPDGRSTGPTARSAKWAFLRCAAGGSQGAVYALSPENGRQAWAYTGELGIVQSGIAVAGGRVYVGDGTGNIVALRA